MRRKNRIILHCPNCSRQTPTQKYFWKSFLRHGKAYDTLVGRYYVVCQTCGKQWWEEEKTPLVAKVTATN